MPSLPVIVLFFASIVWGLAWWPLKMLNSMGIEGVPLALVANGLLAILLTPLLLKQRASWRNKPWPLLLIALFGGAANLAFTVALVYGDVIRVMVLFYLLPVWGVLGGRFILSEKIDVYRWLGVVIAVIGAFVLLGGFSVFKSAPPSWIDLIAVLSGFFFALNNLVFRGVQSIPVISKITAMFYGCSVLAGLVLLSGVQSWPVGIEAVSWGAVVLYGVLWLLIASLGSQWGVTHLEASRSSIIIIVELVTAVISASLIAGEVITGYEAVGGFLVISAALIEALRSEDPAAEVTSSETS